MTVIKLVVSVVGGGDKVSRVLVVSVVGDGDVVIMDSVFVIFVNFNRCFYFRDNRAF